MKRLPRPRRLSRATRCSRCSSWRGGSSSSPEPHALAGQDPGAAVLQPLAAHAGLVPGRRWRGSAAARSSSPRAGHLAARDARGRGDGRRRGRARARGASRCSPPTATRSASAPSPRASDLASGPRRDRPSTPWRPSSTSRSSTSSPRSNHPCQALADWKTMDDLGVPRERRSFVLSWAYHPRALPLAVPAAARAHGGAARHGGRRAAAGGLRAAGADHGAGAARPRPPPAARCARPATATRRSSGAHVLYAKEWGATALYGDAAGGCAAARRPHATGACATTGSHARARTAGSCTACRCGATPRSPTRCSTARAASCSARRYNRLVVQMAVLHRLLKEM